MHDVHMVHKPRVLVCNFHKNDKANLDIRELQEEYYWESCLAPRVQSSGSNGANVASAFGSFKSKSGGNSTETNDGDWAIFMLQTIEINGHPFNIFYDSGYGDLVAKKSAIDILASMGRAKHEIPGPITLSDVGDRKVI